jgi:hypothetical protein
MARIRTLRELMHEAAARSGEQYSIVYRSDVPPVFRSEGVLKPERDPHLKPLPQRKSEQWRERDLFVRKMARSSMRDARKVSRPHAPKHDWNKT